MLLGVKQTIKASGPLRIVVLLGVGRRRRDERLRDQHQHRQGATRGPFIVALTRSKVLALTRAYHRCAEWARSHFVTRAASAQISRANFRAPPTSTITMSSGF